MAGNSVHSSRPLQALLIGPLFVLSACVAPLETSPSADKPLDPELRALFAELDSNGDGKISRNEVPPEDQDAFAEVDVNRDGVVTPGELAAALAEEFGEFDEAAFEVAGDRATMVGVVCSTTPARVRELFAEHPGVKHIELVDVPGSVDDVANLKAARLVRARGVATHVPADGEVASGGVDFFLAGVTRTIEAGARLGVHSWGDRDRDGASFPREHKEHRKYLDYYQEMGIPPEFYWYTLESAPADGIHWMTPDEMRRYGVLTAPVMPGSKASSSEDGYGLDALTPERGPRGIVPLPESVHPAIRRLFHRYTRVVAPNGKPVHILAQSAWTTDQIVRARLVLEHMLAPAPGTKYGADKSAVANAMADRRATLALFNDHRSMERGFRTRFGRLRLGVQDLRANECPVEGSADYMKHETRDAAFEEILHLVHDYGIRPALPEFDAEIQAANDNAEKRGLWDPWPRDEPDSHRNEYIAAAYDNYLDLWTIPPTRYEGEPIPPDEIPAGTSHFGTFKAGSRSRLRDLDPVGFALVESFFPPHLAYTPELPADFEGTFSLTFDAKARYTTASRHLRSVRLTGSGDAHLIGNDAANALLGNVGSNTLEGRGGDDKLDGGPGEDTGVFRGPRSEYSIETASGEVRVVDSKRSRDGVDTLHGVEWLLFADGIKVPVH